MNNFPRFTRQQLREWRADMDALDDEEGDPPPVRKTPLRPDEIAGMGEL